ncbi:MAG: J domain-containing protein, partial [Cyanobacteria bacterium K_DeepCast_35m_m2_023]|nr:J domain-containing protein [Cyanobacteria bacterium K_DeepCast_35m_m2_023]
DASPKLPPQFSAQERQLLEQLRDLRSQDPRADWLMAAKL